MDVNISHSPLPETVLMKSQRNSSCPDHRCQYASSPSPESTPHAHRFHAVGNQLRITHQTRTNMPFCTRSDGQPTFRLISSYHALLPASHTVPAPPDRYPRVQRYRMFFFTVRQVITFTVNIAPVVTISVYSNVLRESRRRNNGNVCPSSQASGQSRNGKRINSV